jgi:SAM-dependent methyltransferase
MPATPSSPLRFYGELAEWWPLVSPVEDYAEEAAFAAGLLGSAAIPVRSVLELGSGGGHNAFHLKPRFDMTLVDLSDEMLAVSRHLNPECEHVRGDMREVRLDRQFDAVFVHDAVAYMASDHDLRLAIDTAFAHCRPGGVAVFVPDETTETFEPSTDHGGSDVVDGRGVRFLEWSWDPDPGDDWTVTQYVFLLRERDGTVRSVHETHRLGLFARDGWLRLLGGAGFEPEAVTEVTSEDRTPRTFFVAHRPSASPTRRPARSRT